MTTIASLVVAMACVATACASSNDADGLGDGLGDGDGVTADCQAQVRLHGVVYTSYGYTKREATRYGAADQAVCHDVGEDQTGSFFPERAQQVTAWTFDSYSPAQVLGVRSGAASFAVFIADSVTAGERDRMTRVLSRPAR